MPPHMPPAFVTRKELLPVFILQSILCKEHRSEYPRGVPCICLASAISKSKTFGASKNLLGHRPKGINCLIGPGDSGKSTVLDAIDYCMGPRRTVPINDADFYHLDVSNPISITITIGELDDALKNIEAYGDFLRSYDADLHKLEDEPETGKETVLTLNLTIAGDLEPAWRLVSERAEAAGKVRYLTWGDRIRLAPTRIGGLRRSALSLEERFGTKSSC